jgi:hypothetical protein
MKVYRKGDSWVKVFNIQGDSYSYTWNTSPKITNRGNGLPHLLKNLKYHDFKLDEVSTVKQILEKYGAII